MEKKIDFNGKWSGEYDNSARKIIPAYDAIYELSRHILMERLNSDADILVAGAGTGKEIISLAQVNSRWLFTGFDPAKPMLSIAEKKVIAASLENRISLIHGRIEDVSKKDFDAATSILVMQFLADDGTKLNFLKGISSRLKPGGIIILVDLEGEIGSGEYNFLNSAWKNHQMFLTEDKEKIEKGFISREKELHFITQSRIKELLEEAGFTEVHKFFQAYLFGGYAAVKGKISDDVQY